MLGEQETKEAGCGFLLELAAMGEDRLIDLVK